MTLPQHSEPAEGRRGPPKAVFCVAGTSSGVGKSSMVVGIAAALRERGLTVQAFKVGPDFIDPMHHEAATGRPSINLDSWMLSREQVLGAFHRAAYGADVAVVEGVMGLFDGRDGTTEQGSTAQLAKWLGVPVVLVLDASAVARSAAAVAKGYIEFDPDLRLGGILFNKVGGPAHTQWLQDAMVAAGIRAEVLGGVPKSEAVVVPERHLGLHMPSDDSVPAGLVATLAELVAAHVDLDALLALGETAEVPPLPVTAGNGGASDDVHEAVPRQQSPRKPAMRIAVARDPAFCFYYHDNLNLLHQAGAELVFFSPLTDPLPHDCAGVYLGGGYPERHAAELAQNRALRASLAAFAKAGGVMYAECGGLIYLSKSIQPSPDEPASPMVGVFPFKTIMSRNKMTMGYVEVQTKKGCPFFPPGRTVRGQVYHFSQIVQESVVGGLDQALVGDQAMEQHAWSTCYRVQPQIPGAAEVSEGFCQQNVLASYVHLHFGNCPDFAASLVDKCRSVDLEVVGAAVLEAAKSAAYLDTAVASQHSTPKSATKGGRTVQQCRSSPDFSRDERLAAKQRLAAGTGELHRGHSEDGLPTARHHVSLPQGENGTHYLLRHGSLAQPGMPLRSLSPATTLSKVVSMNSLSSYSPHIGVGVLPPGEVLSPPLSDSPQQLSPREPELQGAQHGYFGGVPAHMQAAGQQHHLQYGHMNVQLQNGHYGQHQHHQPPHVPPLPLESMASLPYNGRHRQQQAATRASSGHIPNCYSWPHLHQHAPPPLANGRLSASAFAAAAHAPHPPAAPAAPLYPATGTAGGAWGPPNGRHHRSSSYERPPSAGSMLAARSSSPLELHAGLEPRHLALSATPYNWQHSPTPSDKIVSLSPGATELLWALGLGARVAAVSDACDFPPDVVARAKARRSFAAFPSFASSLDRQGSSAATSSSASRRESPTCAQQAQRRGSVAWQLAAAASGGDASPIGGPLPHTQQPHLQAQLATQVEFVVDEEVLARERPGLVVYEEQESALCVHGSAASSAMMCGGCGMGQAVLEALMAVGLQQACRVVCMRRRTLSDVLDSMLVVGEAAGVREEALRTVDRLRARLRRVAGEAAAAAAAAPSRPRVLVLQSLRPLRTVGWWLADQVTLAGGSCWTEEQAGDAPVDLTWEQVQAFAPEVLIVAGMHGGSARCPLTDLCSIASLPGWWLLPAVRASAVYVADAPLFCRPGPRLVEGVECLVRMLWDDQAPACACPERAVLKLSLRPGQRCRPRLLPNHFVPFT